MKAKWILSGLVAMVLVMAPLFSARADDEIENEEKVSKEMSVKPEYITALKQKYNLTDEQVANMQSKGLTSPQMAIASELAKSSGKTLDEILKMRTESKMGWGKIAKELGVSPRETGQSVASLRHGLDQNKHEDKMAIRDAKKEAHHDAKTERREERKQDKPAHGTGH